MSDSAAQPWTEPSGAARDADAEGTSPAAAASEAAIPAGAPREGDWCAGLQGAAREHGLPLPE